MESWQLTPRYFDAPSYLSVDFLSTKLNLCHLFPSIPLDVCFVSQLKRCFNISLHELILSYPILEKIDSGRVSSVVIVLDEDLEAKMSRST
jgi:hypothetical protein